MITRTVVQRIAAAHAMTRFALALIGVFAVTRLPIDPIDQIENFHLPPQPAVALEAWARYDACWYVEIAEHGYDGFIGPYLDLRPGFFPLFPALVALVTPAVQIPLLAGLVVSNACLLIFLVVVWELVRIDWSAEVAWRVVWIYLLFPSSFFLSGAYSESVLLVTTASSILAARRGWWASSGLLAAAATLARPVGFVAVAPLMVEYVASRRARGVPCSMATLASIGAPAVVAAAGYLWFAAYTFGSPLAVLDAQAVYRGSMGVPWRALAALWHQGPRLHAFNNSIVDATLAVIAVTAVPWIFTRVRPSYACYAVFVILVPLSGSLLSFNRMLLPSFPHAILLARFTQRRSVWLILLASFAVLSAVAMAMFATWKWVA